MLKFYLDRLGWSMSEMADHLGVHRSTVTRWNQGKAQLPQRVRTYLVNLTVHPDQRPPNPKPHHAEWRRETRQLNTQRRRPVSNFALPRSRNGVSYHLIDSDFS